MKKMCLVIGMGRSGTSMLSGMLTILGVNFGKRVHGPNQYNKKGYFEDAALCDSNDFLVHGLGGSPQKPEWAKKLNGHPPIFWLYPHPFKEGWEETNGPLVQKIKNLLAQRLNQYEYFGLKDPRATLTLPIYMRILKELNTEVKIISIKRNPESVAKSLFNFHNFKVPREDALKICERYNNDILEFNKRYEMHHTFYEDIVSNPIDNAEALALYLGLPFTENTKKQIKDFVDSKLKHN